MATLYPKISSHLPTRVSLEETIKDLHRLGRWHATVLTTLGVPPDECEAFLTLPAAEWEAWRAQIAPPGHRTWFADSLGAAMNMRVWHIWQRTKVVYDLNPVLASELAGTLPGGQLPGDVLEHLPHPDPCVVWTRPPIVRTGSGGRGALRAAFVHGSTIGEELCSTHDPRRKYLRFLFVVDVLDGTLGPDDHEFSAALFPHDVGSIEAVLDTMAGRWNADGYDDLRRAHLSDVVGHLLPVILYACSAEPDMTRKPPRPSSKKRGRGHGPAINRVGYRIGPAIDAARRARTAASGTAGSDRSLDPHVRRAHWHAFKVGRGRTGVRLRWLNPILVGLGDIATPTVVRQRRAAARTRH